MTQILIYEPNDFVKTMLERMVRRLGCEPIAVSVPSPEELTSADVFVIEPASPVGTALAQAAAIANPDLPLVCASVTAPPAELAALGVGFAATLVKPFTSEQLRAALAQALAQTLRGDRGHHDCDDRDECGHRDDRGEDGGDHYAQSA